MALIEPAAVPRVEVDFMNEDHLEAVDLVNALDGHIEAGLEAGTPPDELDEALERLAVHTREHFAREEEQMLRVGFPPYAVHKAEHERVLEEMRVVVERWAEDRNLAELEQYVRRALPPWFIEHIATMDTITAQFIAARGG